MRKLTVKNFSVIKEAELEFGKFTVLIGPQSSGKSLLCKLAYFFCREIPEIATESAIKGYNLVGFSALLRAQFSQRFTAYDGFGLNASASYTSGQYSASASWTDLRASEDVNFEFSEGFIAVYKIATEQAGSSQIDATPQPIVQDRVWNLLNDFCGGVNTLEAHYVPADRSLFAVTDLGFSALRSPAVDPLLLRFAREIVWGGRWRIGTITAGDGALDDLHAMIEKISGGSVSTGTGTPLFLDKRGRKLPLSALSSGTQELLPLLNVLDRFATEQEHRRAPRLSINQSSVIFRTPDVHKLVFLEEPEANIFPSTQKELVQLFAWLTNNQNWCFSWVITTHSPYIMTAFNTLIQAGRVGSLPGNREKVGSFIPEQYWIKEGDFKAYAMEDGKLVSIFKPESEDPEGQGMINGDYLDGVSDQLGKEFSRLLDIEFAK